MNEQVVYLDKKYVNSCTLVEQKQPFAYILQNRCS